MVPERWETRVCERNEGGWEEMHEGGRNENAGAKVTGEEEEMMRNGEARKAAHYDGKRTCYDAIVKVNSLDQGEKARLTSCA